MMTDAPERIWAAPPYDDPEWKSGAGEWDVSDDWAVSEITQYVRADIVQALTEERDRLSVSNMQMLGDIAVAMGRIEALTAERDRLLKAMDYILDGMGIAEPDYDIDPDDDFLDAANSEWVRDTLTRLAAALKGETP